MQTTSENKIAELTKSLFAAQLALGEASNIDLFKEATPREAVLIVKKLRNLREQINALIGI